MLAVAGTGGNWWSLPRRVPTASRTGTVDAQVAARQTRIPWHERRQSLMGFRAKMPALHLTDAGVSVPEPICRA